MEMNELLEKLAQLQKSLEDVESARKMVNKTVEAYKEGSNQIKTYSKQLSSVSEQIGQLVEQIKQNNEAISSEVDEKIKVAIKGMEKVSDTFSNKTKELIESFDRKTSEKAHDFSSKVDETKTTLILSANDSEKTRAKTIEAITTASSKLDVIGKELKGINEQQYNDFKEVVSKKITVFGAALAVLVIVDIVIQFLH